MRVFIPEENQRYNFDAAKTYGELLFMGEQGTVNPFKPDIEMDEMLNGLEDQDFDPKEDFLCLTGKSLVVALFLAAAVRKYGTVKTLMFDARVSAYRERIITSPGEQ